MDPPGLSMSHQARHQNKFGSNERAPLQQVLFSDDKPPDQTPAASSCVRGSSRALEKPYFRLTAAPDLTTVRPPPVLKLALKHVQQHWIQVNSTLPSMHPGRHSSLLIP